ncbi:hypothetical protein HAD_13074 [Hyphomonas adhaerens MHS-3]|uniref:Uncharacterized protein n=1 Tax=Hyphomonas adhaerens MHS-3 TaxID=1280949 RepID=A0A069E253_9PROT|nr:hypothetical protein [Hyphomonas adhaerens]KCZ83535.1 hypothetical protein HAD_13074 [Hyphomonas adhaerens MHS-3]
MRVLRDEFHDRLDEFEAEYDWLEHDNGKSILALIGELIERMTSSHKANVSMAALIEIVAHGDVLEWDWSRLSKTQITPHWREELEEAMSYSVLNGPDLFDRLHDLNAFAYFGMIPNWNPEYWPDPTDPRSTVVLSRREAQRDLEKWVQDVCEEVDELEKLLPAAQLKSGLFDACLTTRTAAKARLAYDKGDSLSIAELAALSRVSMKRLQNAVYAKTDEAPLVAKDGKIAAENARAWLEARDYKPSIWQAIEDLQPLNSDWGEDVPYGSETSESKLADYVFIPVANDGSEFLPELCWRDGRGASEAGYTIGPKGAEQKVADYRTALDILSKMETPRWRRPNPESGNWGIVTGQSWRRVALAGLNIPNSDQLTTQTQEAK